MKNMKRLFIIFLSAVVLFGCGAEIENTSTPASENQQAETLQENGAESKESKIVVADTDLTAGMPSISIKDIPSFSDSPYVELNGNQPNFSDSDKKSTEAFETYSELDRLGRCGVAYANICPEIEPTEERGAIGAVRPSGWHTVKYNDLIDGNYLYNRCHLIGYQLAGENANPKNLITGTRYLNVMGMLPYEDMVDDYVDATGNHVLYRVTPIFENDNLVASGVEMEGWSVEDKGKGICFHIYCYNVQPGIGIDYVTGESWRLDGTKSEEESGNNVEAADKEAESVDSQKAGTATVQKTEFIINTNTKKFHLPSCSSVKTMVDKNKKTYEGTMEELKQQGYSPCKRCLK